VAPIFLEECASLVITTTKSRNLDPNVRAEVTDTTVEEADKFIHMETEIIISEREMGGGTKRGIKTSPKFSHFIKRILQTEKC
jgi:hypothetical protein